MSELLQLDPNQATPELKALFNPSDPAALRCQAVMEGQTVGTIFTDHPETPTWGILQEATFGSIYLGGVVPAEVIPELLASQRASRDVLVGLWEKDPRWLLFPFEADYSGHTLEFTNRATGRELPAIPQGCTLQRLNATLAKEILDRNLLIRMYGTIQAALEWGYGLCLTRGDEILCEAFAGPSANGVIEIGVETNPHHMQKGYGYITCEHLIQQMETQGYETYWNCSKNNLPSTALARKLGYRTEKEYHMLAWFKDEGPRP